MSERPGDLGVGIHQPGGRVDGAEPVAARSLGHRLAAVDHAPGLHQIARQLFDGGLAMDFVLQLGRKNGYGAALARGEGIVHVHGMVFRNKNRISRGATGFISHTVNVRDR